MDLRRLFDLEPHGPDTFVGAGPRYPWGGLYGGQIVGQALRAAASTTDDDLAPHSLRAYFIRRGDHAEPVRYEVDRIRNGRSFATRRVVARQAVGAILNLEASFQRAEPSADLQTIAMPAGVPAPDDLEPSSWNEAFDRRFVGTTGRTLAWMKVNDDLGSDQLLHRCWLAYLSDDLPTDAVRDARGNPDASYGASLDHTIWFHRPVRADQWHLYEMTCHGYQGARGLAIGHVFAPDGIHVATVAQEVLLRDRLAE